MWSDLLVYRSCQCGLEMDAIQLENAIKDLCSHWQWMFSTFLDSFSTSAMLWLSDLIHLMASPEWYKSWWLQRRNVNSSEWHGNAKVWSNSKHTPWKQGRTDFRMKIILRSFMIHIYHHSEICSFLFHSVPICFWRCLVVLLVVRPIEEYHYRLHPAPQRDLPNLVPALWKKEI